MFGVSSYFVLSLVLDISELFSVPISSLLLDFFSFQFSGTKINGTTMLKVGLKVIKLFSTVNHNGESTIESSRICPRLVLQIGLDFTSNKVRFLVEMRILLSLVLFRPCRRAETVGGNEIKYHLYKVSWLCLIL